jgi:hypothetical protein
MAITSDLAGTDLVMRTGVTDGISGPLTGANKLWLPIWSGEVIHAYDEYNVFEQLVDSKTITSGVAMEFPITGTVALRAAWDAGQELGGGDSSSTTIAVKLDKRPMAAHFEIDNVDLMQTQWEFRSELARQAGMTLANARDKQIAAYIARAAMEDLCYDTVTANGPFDGDGTPANSMLLSIDPRGVITGPVYLRKEFFNLGNTAATLAQRNTAALLALQSIEEFFVYLQTINAPTDGVVLAVTPRVFQDIRSLGVARSDAGLFGNTASSGPLFGGVAEAGGLGAQLTMGMHNLSDSLEYQGCMIIKSNHLPVQNYAAGSIGEARYCEEFGDAGVCGLLFQKGCVASLKLQGLKVDTVDDIRRNTVFTVASMMNGTGVLRPECAAVLIKPTTLNTDVSSASEVAIAANFKLFRSTTTFAATTTANWDTGGAVTFVNSYVDNAGEGGEEASKARFVLRRITGMTREYLPTAGGSSPGFPYN